KQTPQITAAPGKKTPGLPGVLFCAREISGSGSVSALLSGLVVLHRLLQVSVFLAGKKAQLVEPRKVLLGLRKIVHHEIGLADVLVRSPVPGVEAQRLVVVLERKVEVAGLAPGVAEVILRVGVVRFARG